MVLPPLQGREELLLPGHAWIEAEPATLDLPLFHVID